MKKSNYNFIWDYSANKKIAFNSMTCALAEIEESFIEVLENIDNISYENLSNDKKNLVDKMKEGGYIIDDEFDELKSIKFRHLSGKFNQKGLGLTIAPTLNCNFKCIYCYETPKAVKMDIDCQNALLDFIKKQIKGLEYFGVTWYGGEPLLCKDIIYKLSEEFIKLCNKNNVKYNAYIISNGYLIDDETIKNFKKYKISGAQLTIDGPEQIHNKRRILKSNKDDNFKRVFNSVKMLKENGIKPSVRINIDKDNIEYVDELIDIFRNENMDDIDIHFGQVTPYTESCKSISESCFDTEEFSEKLIKLQDKLNNKGFSAMGYPYYPGIKSNYCCSDQINSFVIDPDGNMYKCWNEVGNISKSVGNIKRIKDNKEEHMINNMLNYMTWTPFESKQCTDCQLLPVCMGGCPYMRINNDVQTKCERWKFNLEDILKYTYTCYLKYPQKFKKVFQDIC